MSEDPAPTDVVAGVPVFFTHTPSQFLHVELLFRHEMADEN